NYALIGSISHMAIGTSTSSSLYQLFGGFLYFPYVTTPIVEAIAGNGKVNLIWTTASAGVGWSVGSYAVGQSLNSGGPYSFTNVGDVSVYRPSDLANGTEYYFIVRVLDAFDNTIATSTEVSATPLGVVYTSLATTLDTTVASHPTLTNTNGTQVALLIPA